MSDTTPGQELAQSPGALQRWINRLLALFQPDTWRNAGKTKASGMALGLVVVLLWLLSVYWDTEPELFNVQAQAQQRAEAKEQLVKGALVPGYITTATLLEISRQMLEKPGGYLSNDKLPPSVFMDNIPSWEFGVLVQVRDFSQAMRNDLTRSQSQSTEDKDWAEAQPKFNFDNSSWLLPPSEGEYREAMKLIENYLARLTDDNANDAQFFGRSDNLRDWLKTVGKRLGSLSQQLSASVAQERFNTDLAGEADAKQAHRAGEEMRIKTSWLEIDDVFYEARGTAWALIHLLHAVEIDFRDVLEKRNATTSLNQIIRELEATQKTVWSPMILNGSDFGLFANHSLVMSSYISRANAGIIDLRNLLGSGG